MSTPKEHRPETIRAARLAFNAAVAHVWQQSASAEDTIEQIAQIIEIDTNLSAMRDALALIVKECEGGKTPNPTAVNAAREAINETNL